MEIKRFVKTSFEVQAVQIIEDNASEVAEWCGGEITHSRARGIGEPQVRVVVTTSTKNHSDSYVAKPGDWVLRKETSEEPQYYICSNRSLGNLYGEIRDFGEDAPQHLFKQIHEAMDGNRTIKNGDDVSVTVPVDLMHKLMDVLSALGLDD